MISTFLNTQLHQPGTMQLLTQSCFDSLIVLSALSLWSCLSNFLRVLFFFLAASGVARYAWAVFIYHQAQNSQHISKHNIPQAPPTYPELVPFVGNMFAMGFKTAAFVLKATNHHGRMMSTRISMAGFPLYIFQDKESVNSILRRRSSLTSSTIRYIFPGKYLFGMPEKQGLDAYRADNSGPLPKPRPGSNVLPENRIDYLHHQAFQRAFTGPELASYAYRYRDAFKSRLDSKGFAASSWTDLADMFEFISRDVTSALTESVFGSSLLRRHPEIINELWAYDEAAPWLSKMIPSWLYPKPYRARERLSQTLKSWNQHARRMAGNSSSTTSRDSYDPVWGSGLVRDLQQALFETGKHSDDAMAAHDMGILWATTTNPASAAALAVFHIFHDPELLRRVRAELDQHLGSGPSDSTFSNLSPKELYKLPLLSSIYAETLRLYSQIFLVRASPPDRDVHLGKWIFPRSSFGIISTTAAHKDKAFWNTRGGQYPVDIFWADRFIVDPGDPTSGPIAPQARIDGVVPHKVTDEGASADPYFTTEGLEASFIPFGAGVSQCPGRLLARDAIMSTCVLLVRKYELHVAIDKLSIDLWRFGLGVGRPTHPVPARMRRYR